MKLEWSVTFEYVNGTVEEVRGYNIAELLEHARELLNKKQDVIKSFDVNIVRPKEWMNES